MLGHQTMLADSSWPTADDSLIADNIIKIGVQVNGKLRDTISLVRDCPKQEAAASCLGQSRTSEIVSRSLPLTCTPILIILSAIRLSSAVGQLLSASIV